MDVMDALSLYQRMLKAFEESHSRKPSERETNEIYDEVCVVYDENKDSDREI